jgi:hypothetical protein
VIRLRVLKILLVLVGLALVGAIYPLAGALRDTQHSTISTGDQMILGIYFPIGIFLLMAARNPPANRSLIACFAWSTLAHDAVMVRQAFQGGSMRTDGPALAVLGIICVAFLALAPRKPSANAMSSVPVSG